MFFLLAPPLLGPNLLLPGEVEISGDEASVEVTQIYSASDPFSTGYRDVQRAILVRQNAAWKLSSMPAYNFGITAGIKKGRIDPALSRESHL